MSTSLAPRDAERLADLEVTIAQGLTTFVEVGSALSEIREARLYRESHGTFEDYCRDRWQMSRPRAYELIHASSVVAGLSAIADMPLPTNEAQTRPLAALPPEQQREVWKEAVETAPAGKVTAAHVAATVERKRAEEGVIPIHQPRPEPAAPITARDALVAESRSPATRVAAYVCALPIDARLTEAQIREGVADPHFDRSLARVVEQNYRILRWMYESLPAERRQHVTA
jgi:hypothetical protein